MVLVTSCPGRSCKSALAEACHSGLSTSEAEVTMTGNGKNTLWDWPRGPGTPWHGSPQETALQGAQRTLGRAAVETEGIPQLNPLPGLPKGPCAVELLRVEEQQGRMATPKQGPVGNTAPTGTARPHPWDESGTGELGVLSQSH